MSCIKKVLITCSGTYTDGRSSQILRYIHKDFVSFHLFCVTISVILYKCNAVTKIRETKDCFSRWLWFFQSNI